MRWIRMIAILLLSILTSGLLALHGQQLVVDNTDDWAMDPGGNLYLLSEQQLNKLSEQGTLLWSVQLPEQNTDGTLLRYRALTADSGGSLYLAVQVYERYVDAAGVVEEVILAEEIQAWNGDGVQQESVLHVDKTMLAQRSIQPYIQRLQVQGDRLLALCCDQGRFDVICTQPYGDGAPEVIASYPMGDRVEELEDCVALSDGTLVCSTKGGSLYAWLPDGTQQSLEQLVGQSAMAGRLTADDADRIFFLDRSNGALYQMSLESYTVQRCYSPDTVLDAGSGLTFAQIQGVEVSGSQGFCGRSIDSKAPFWVRFGTDTVVIDHIHRGWSCGQLIQTGLVFLAVFALMWLVTWLLGSAGRRWRLTGKILRQFLPALLGTLILLAGGAVSVYTTAGENSLRQDLAAMARAVAGQMDVRTLAVDFRRCDAEVRRSLSEQLNAAGSDAASILGWEEPGLILYGLEGDQYYGLTATRQEDAFSSASYLAPLTQEFSAQTAQEIIACADGGGSVAFRRGDKKYVSYVQPVVDAGGKAIALVEVRGDRTQGHTGAEPLLAACIVGGIAGGLLLVWLIVTLGMAFRPLKELSGCIAQISAGNWNVRARITSRDELADIGVSFNQMTEKLNQYISNMVFLNNEYIKFIPRELFQLMGKSKVTDLSLRDKSVRDMSLLYVTFGMDGARLNSEAYFALMNDNFDKIFDVVEINHGIIERFDGAGMLALFPRQVQDALNTAISLKEMMTREDRTMELKMLISADETLIGVAGNQKRQTITAISDTIMDIYALNSLMEELGARYIMTRSAVERVGDEFYFNCREIGAGDSGRESLYEFLDGMDTYEKKLHLVTREEFEQGLNHYRAGHYAAARKHFAGVLQTNERDVVAMHYLMLCDIHTQTEAALTM